MPVGNHTSVDRLGKSNIITIGWVMRTNMDPLYFGDESGCETVYKEAGFRLVP